MMKRWMKRKRTLTQRIAATALSLAMVVSLLPFTVLAQNDAPVEGKTELAQKFNELMDPGTPQNYDPNMANPYGYDKGQKFLLSEQNELLFYYTFDTGNNAGNKTGNRHTAWYNRYAHGGSATLRDDNKGTVQGGFSEFGEYATTDAYSYVAATAFDPTGSGRRDHVAYVGYENVKDRGQGYYVWILNTRTGAQYGPTRISKAPTDACSWLDKSNVDLYAGSNFFGIVAGDFDGDGKENLILTVTDNDNRYGLYNLSLNDKKNIITHEWEEKGQLHPIYVANQSKMGDTNGDMGSHKLSVSLAVGDFNGDGIDDLATLSYPNVGNRLNGKSDLLDARFGLPYVSVTYGIKGDSYPLNNRRTGGYVTDGEKTYTLDMNGMPSVSVRFDHATSVCTGLAAGDIDGDGVDEIVTAGYYAVSSVYEENNGNKYMGYEYLTLEDDKWLYGSFSAANGSLSNIEYRKLDRNEWSKNGAGENDCAGAKVAVACVAMDGKTNPDSVFVSGNIYRCQKDTNKLDTSDKLDDNGQKINNPFTLPYFTAGDKGAESHTVPKSYLTSLAVGNFEETDDGSEQLFFVVGLQAKNATVNDKYRYYFSIHSVGVASRDSNGLAKSYLYEAGGYVYRNQKFGLDKRPNVLVVAIDRDDDGIVASYKEAGYTWSDPKLITILQASPYFDEVGDYLYDSPETTYNETVTYTMEYGTSKSVSFGAGATLTMI